MELQINILGLEFRFRLGFERVCVTVWLVTVRNRIKVTSNNVANSLADRNFLLLQLFSVVFCMVLFLDFCFFYIYVEDLIQTCTQLHPTNFVKVYAEDNSN